MVEPIDLTQQALNALASSGLGNEIETRLNKEENDDHAA